MGAAGCCRDQRRLGIHRTCITPHLAMRDTIGFVRQAEISRARSLWCRCGPQCQNADDVISCTNNRAPSRSVRLRLPRCVVPMSHRTYCSAPAPVARGRLAGPAAGLPPGPREKCARLPALSAISTGPPLRHSLLGAGPGRPVRAEACGLGIHMWDSSGGVRRRPWAWSAAGQLRGIGSSEIGRVQVLANAR